MLQRVVDHALAVTKESVKTFTNESLNNIVRLINGISALVLAFLPGKSSMLEGIQGWELRPKFRGPRLPRWMENGVSSFNEFVHELSMDSDTSSTEDYASGEEDNELNITPASPSSHASFISRTSSFARRDRYSMRFIKWLLSLILWPVTCILSLPFIIYHKLYFRGSRDHQANPTMLGRHVTKISSQIKDNVVHRATDRRRGVVEDLQLASEIFIEATFENFHKVAHYLLSPSEIFWMFYGWFCCHGRREEMSSSVPTATLADSDPTPTVRERERERSFYHSLNIDARTCQDVIGELGYPYEAIRVVTSDGYVLLLERIPRRDARKAMYFQHGVFDSSMGWVSNGVVGSPAFAAYDQGFDVFLGNFRGLASREHVDKNISSRKYWRYSINEHGTEDVPAMIEKIHEIKTSELAIYSPPDSDEHVQEQPYKLCAVSHSLGGAAMLMYIITRRIEQKPHRLCRLILLSPAGFHEDSSIVFTMMEYFLLLLSPVLALVMPGIYIPTRFFRMLVNKLARDFQNYPAFGGLVQTLVGYVVGGDSSNWIGVLGLPHYNMYDMPGVSLRVGLHLAQMKWSKRFAMYDYGSAAANMEVYGSVEPLDLGQHYDLIDIPVDLVAGKKDKVIRPSMVRKHYKHMRRAGVEVSYNEFEYAHLDFTFSHREELLTFVMSRLLLVVPAEKPHGNQSNIRLRKTSKSRARNEGKDAEFTEVTE